MALGAFSRGNGRRPLDRFPSFSLFAPADAPPLFRREPLPDEGPRVAGRIPASVADREFGRMAAARGRCAEGMDQRSLHREAVARNPLPVDAERPGRNPREIIPDVETQGRGFRQILPFGEERADRRRQRVGNHHQVARRARDGRHGSVGVGPAHVGESAFPAASGQYGAQPQLPRDLCADRHEGRLP